MTSTALKLVLALAVSLLGVTTNVTPLTRVSGVHQNYGNPKSFSFVFYKASELPETPVTVLSPVLRASNPSPRANVGKVFQRDGSLRAFSFQNQLFRDPVVHVFLKSSLPPRKLFQPSLGTLGSYGLKFISSFLVPNSSVLHHLGGNSFTVTRNRNVGNAKVYTQNVFRLEFLRLFQITGSTKEPFSFVVNQIRFSLLNRKESFLSFTASIRNFCSTESQNPDGNFFSLSEVRQDSGVVRDRSMFLESSLNLFIKLISVYDFRYTTYDHLGSEIKLFSNPTVNILLEPCFLKKLLDPSNLTYLVASNVGSFKCKLESLSLTCTGKQFNLSYDLHART